MKRVIVVTLFLFVVITASSVFAQTPSFKVAWKQGIIMGLLVPPNTTKEQLKYLIYKFRQARKEKTLSALIPPVNRLPDPYTGFIIFIFSDPKWATSEEYYKYESASTITAKGLAISRAYINHIMAYYEYEFQDGKEHGSLGFDDCNGDKSVHYKKLF
jgi:hypothetical protein